MTTMQNRMLPTDAFAWHMEERDPVLRSTVVAIMRLEGSPDWARLRRRVDQVSRHVPRLRQRVLAPTLPWRGLQWIGDDGFDLDFHLARERVPAPGTWYDVLSFARRATMEDFDRARPLWRCWLLDGLEDGSSVFVTKIHHSLTDGLGGMQIIRLLADPGPEQRVVHLPPVTAGFQQPGPLRPVRAVLSGATNLVDLGRDVARSAPPAVARAALHPVSTAGQAAALTSSVVRMVAPIRHPFSRVLRERRYGRMLATIDVPLAALRTAAAAADAHVNDAFLAAVVEGLYLYHDERRAFLPEIRATIPVSVRRPADGVGGNRITLVRATLPAGEEEITGRIAQIAEVVRSWRREPALAHTQEIAFGLNLVPRAYLAGVLKRVEVVASNVPGPAEPMWLAGARVIGYYPFGPTIGAALNVTLISYADVCHVGINIDSHAVDDPQELVRCLSVGFDEVLGTSGPPTRSHLECVSEVVTTPRSVHGASTGGGRS